MNRFVMQDLPQGQSLRRHLHRQKNATATNPAAARVMGEVIGACLIPGPSPHDVEKGAWLVVWFTGLRPGGGDQIAAIVTDGVRREDLLSRMIRSDPRVSA